MKTIRTVSSIARFKLRSVHDMRPIVLFAKCMNDPILSFCHFLSCCVSLKRNGTAQCSAKTFAQMNFNEFKSMIFNNNRKQARDSLKIHQFNVVINGMDAQQIEQYKKKNIFFHNGIEVIETSDRTNVCEWMVETSGMALDVFWRLWKRAREWNVKEFLSFRAHKTLEDSWLSSQVYFTWLVSRFYHRHKAKRTLFNTHSIDFLSSAQCAGLWCCAVSISLYLHLFYLYRLPQLHRSLFWSSFLFHSHICR